jgi:hypothetical protein
MTGVQQEGNHVERPAVPTRVQPVGKLAVAIVREWRRGLTRFLAILDFSPAHSQEILGFSRGTIASHLRGGDTYQDDATAEILGGKLAGRLGAMFPIGDLPYRRGRLGGPIVRQWLQALTRFLISEGFSQPQTGQILQLSRSTIQNYLTQTTVTTPIGVHPYRPKKSKRRRIVVKPPSRLSRADVISIVRENVSDPVVLEWLMRQCEH